MYERIGNVYAWLIASLVVGWVLCVYLDPFAMWLGTPVGVSHLLVVPLVAAVVLRGRYDCLRLSRTVGAFFAVMGVALLFWSMVTVDGVSSLRRTVTIAYYMVITLCVLISAERSRGVRQGVIYAVIAASLLYIPIAVAYGYDPVFNRITLVPDYNPTWFAAFLVAGIYVCVYQVEVSLTMRMKLVYGAICLILLLGVIGAQARNALVALLLSVAIVYGGALLKSVANLSWLRASPATAMSSLVLCVFLTAAGGYTGWTLVERGAINIDRIELIWQDDPSRATAGRIDLWNDAIRHISEGNVVSGINNASYTLHNTPHNQYLTFFLETAGTLNIPWILIHAYLIWIAFRYSKRKSVIACALFLPIFAIGNDVFYYKYYWVLVMVGLVLCVDGISKAGQQQRVERT